MPVPDVMFCAQQINIPPELPDIMKQFTKAAIRTQPPDILQWSAAYFSALSKGETLPVKERLEMPVATQKTDTGLTPGLLKVLHKQLARREVVTIQELQQKWKDVCLPVEQLHNILKLGNFGNEVVWMQFFALGCSALGGSIASAVKHACEILTTDPEGGPARIPFATFKYLYSYLAELDGDISQSEASHVLSSLEQNVLLNALLQPETTTPLQMQA
ncbi:ropporin-1-like protein isoform X1 [Latimeria chalumnae]|uniref:ropporin-1-like protein isoform X1 n=1 Tax=Latimeria chalumnae TaxID=7897 RepID=UPI0006D8E22D|nr:PREDICTED: ropporin-1-like protein isoform X2 [Latimeria chalumnae]|eukprot:XP_014350415.1 PREDICTED: ropporin-1-like protein isoform X2 [Latimeria chalumnae]